MTQQLDFFKAPAPMIEQPAFILPDNTLVLVQPAENPTGAEASERRAARLREIEDRKAAKTSEGVLNATPGRVNKWELTA
jgi:hypothetical protein